MFYWPGKSKCDQCVFSRGNRCLLSKAAWLPCSMGIQKIDEVQKIETHLQLVMSRNSTRMRTLLSLIALAGSLTSMTISYRALEFNQGRIGELVDSRMVPMLEQTKRGIETSIDARFWKAFETLREERKGESR